MMQRKWTIEKASDVPMALKLRQEPRRPSFRFSDIWKSPPHDLAVRDELLFQYLPLSRAMDVLECGPGAGFTAFRLSRLVNHLTLLDIALGTVANLKETLKNLPNVDFVCTDVCLPGLDERLTRRFDAVFGLEVFALLSDPEQALRNLGSILKQNGTLLLNWGNYSTARTKGVTYIPTLAELGALLTGAGFKSWEVYTLRLRPHAQLLNRLFHEKPVEVFARLRGQPDRRSARTFDLTWTHQHGKALARYRALIHLYWMLVMGGFRLGGDCFSRTRITEGAADGNLLLLATR